MLGSIAPSVAQQKMKVDEAKPVKVRLADGSRLTVKQNHVHTVADIRVYINTARPQYEGVQYMLLTTFPNKEVTDDTATVASARLVGAAGLQCCRG